MSLVRHFRTAIVGKEPWDLEAEEVLVAVTRASGPNRFRAVRTQVRYEDQVVFFPKAARELLKVKPGDKVSIIPFE